jgi:hypothetical protein
MYLVDGWFDCHTLQFSVFDYLTITRLFQCFPNMQIEDFHSFKGYFGIFLLFIIDLLSFWLSVSVLLSWVMSSKYFFPVPNIPIRPAQLLTINGGDAGALGKYMIDTDVSSQNFEIISLLFN